LARVPQVYAADFGVDVCELPGGGAAGGLAGGLAALGASLTPGFELVADALDLVERVASADLVVTGEGFLDAQSFEGKAVGGVVGLARDMGVPVVVVVGEVGDDAPTGVPGVTVVSLVDQVGRARALADTEAALTQVLAAHLRSSTTEPKTPLR
jgi:glycerate kinase